MVDEVVGYDSSARYLSQVGRRDFIAAPSLPPVRGLYSSREYMLPSQPSTGLTSTARMEPALLF